MTTKTTKKTIAVADPLSRVGPVAALLDHGRGSVADYLPLADAELPTLLADGGDPDLDPPLTESAIERAAARIAGQHCDTYATSAKVYNAWSASAGANVSDEIDTLMCENTQAAFALGMALGLRLGGGAR
jgi:hypothetical protein